MAARGRFSTRLFRLNSGHKQPKSALKLKIKDCGKCYDGPLRTRP